MGGKGKRGTKTQRLLRGRTFSTRNLVASPALPGGNGDAAVLAAHEQRRGAGKGAELPEPGQDEGRNGGKDMAETIVSSRLVEGGRSRGGGKAGWWYLPPLFSQLPPPAGFFFPPSGLLSL